MNYKYYLKKRSMTFTLNLVYQFQCVLMISGVHYTAERGRKGAMRPQCYVAEARIN